MDPFARKMWRAGLVYAGLLAVMAFTLTVVYLHKRPRCGDRIVSESNSPDRRWTATVLERRCGDDAPFITQINVRDGGTKLERGFLSGQTNENNVFLLEQDAAGAALQFEWNGHDKLTIHCEHCDVRYLRRHEPQHGQLKITYAFR